MRVYTEVNYSPYLILTCFDCARLSVSDCLRLVTEIFAVCCVICVTCIVLMIQEAG